ncbi:(2Fe-2S)-binding protein [Chamaesiphon sp.]|uniref:putative iron-sulfur cluster-binding metallochaperone n=1 Tax=Chamaesiphon sp. TaxID=2814140 RepID=UPI003593970D
MSQCCNLDRTTENVPVKSRQRICPIDGTKGKPAKLVTLKSLLIGAALEKLDPRSTYTFCPSSNCSVVYFSDTGQTFMTVDLKVPVFQKDFDEQVPACYCFDWSRQRIREEIEQTGTSTAVASIAAHIKAKRCGCEVNNPQGVCCLANVRETVHQIPPLLSSSSETSAA